MSEPEIARRCPACGATVRMIATFCPHCGAPLQHHAATPETVAPPPSAADSFATKPPDDYKVSDRHGNRSAERREASTVGNRRGAIATKAVAARDQVEENLRPRVAKLRQTSSTVLDEAADDPGLRFVLIAAVLFLLTLALLVFSKLLN